MKGSSPARTAALRIGIVGIVGGGGGGGGGGDGCTHQQLHRIIYSGEKQFSSSINSTV